MYVIPYLLLLRLHRLALDARRRDRTWRYYMYSVSAALLAVGLAAFAALAAYAMWHIGWWPLAIAVVVMFVAPPLQPVISRRVLVPLGWYRLAFWAGHFVSIDDSDAYGLACAAWAHARKPSIDGEAWITARRDKRIPLGDSEIVVTALLASARGDADTCRQLLRSTAYMVEDHPLVREIAGEWLAVDAAERGAWAELHADAIAATWPASALTYFLEAIASRRVDAKTSPGDFELFARWLLAPYRRGTRKILVAVHEPTPARSAVVGESELPEGALPRAIHHHVTIAGGALANGSLADGSLPSTFSIASLDELVHAWDSALVDRDVQTWLARRALELDAPEGAVDRAIRDVAQTVTDEIARMADAAGLGAPTANGPVGEALMRRLRHGRLDALESGFNRWEQRRHTGSVRSPIDEWREWVALRAQYEAAAAAGGLELRRLAFPHAYSKGTSMAVWLWNARNEYALSHAISAWLRDEAMAVGDAEAIELCSRNSRLNVPTRTGDVRKVT